MVDRYATNQFYNFNSYEGIFGDTESQSVGSKDNPAFIYPPKTLRNSVSGDSKPMQRGYLRMMAEIMGEDLKDKTTLARRRLHFQFNPDIITRAVNARNDIQLWMNMDPSQITQPVPGDSNFSFELLFNREAEVSSGTYLGKNYGLNPAAKDPTTLRNITAPTDLPIEGSSAMNHSSVADIGVLADLIVFDELIGQGINSQLLESISKRAELGSKYAAAKAAQNTEESTSDEEDKPPKGGAPKIASAAEIKTALESNWGNSAFLISQPIRVVFSSLFMVEGYVSATIVTFNKFSPTMVPTQAVVGVTMQAMYMGFAKKDTFFTKTFSDNEKEYKKVIEETSAEEKALTGLGKNLFKKVGGQSSSGVLALENDYKVSLDGVLGQEDTDKCNIRFMASDLLKQNIKDKANISSIDITAALTYIYKGNSGTIPAGVNVAVDTTVYSTTTTVKLSVNEFKNDTPWSMANIEWQNQPIIGINPDMSNTSQYQLRFAAYATLTGAGGSSVPKCTQILQLVKENVSWGEKVDIGENATLTEL